MKNIDDLIEKLAQDTATTKPVSHPFVLSLQWMCASAIYLVILFTVLGLRSDVWQKLQDPWFVAEIVTLLAIFLSTSLSTALLGFPDLHQKRYLALIPAGVFLLFLLFLIAACCLVPIAPLPAHGSECALAITAMALLPATWMFYSMRHYASTHNAIAGSTTLLSAFSVGALWLRLYESNDSIMHVIAWHYFPMLVVGVIGLWLGRWLLKW